MQKIVLTGAAALALVAGGTAAGAAIAAGPIDSSGVIHGCYYPPNTHGSSRIVLQDTTISCPAGTTAITWNQTGQPGPQGPQGAQGPAGAGGPQGAVGPAGANGVNGNTILSGTGPPAASAGTDGDFYVDTAADVLYGPKISGAWPATGTSLVGPAGPAGATGPTGPAGPPGAGTAGTTGLDLISTVANGGIPGSPNIAEASCPADHPYLFGGGGSAVDASNNHVPVLTSNPNLAAILPAEIEDEGLIVSQGGVWTWDVTSPTGTFANAYAICGK